MLDDNRGRLILAALWISESVRIFAFASIFTLLLGLDAAALAWVAVAALLGVSMIVNWITGGARGDLVTLAIVQAAAGLPAIYLAPAARAFGGVDGLDLNWAISLTGGDLSGDAVVGVIFALVLAVLVWLRGAAIVRSPEPEAGQRIVFYTGAAALGVLLVMERAVDADLNTRFLILPFFAAALGGMAINRLASAREGALGSAFWGRFTTAAVSGVLGLAIGITTLAVVWNDAIRAVGKAVGFVVTWIIIIIAAPFAVVAIGLIKLFQLFRGDGSTQLNLGAGAPDVPPDMPPDQITSDGGSGLFETVINVLKFPLAAILLLAIGIVLYITFRRFLAKRRARSGDERESVRGDADAAKDMAGLLARLIPDWMKRHRSGEASRRFPENEPGITDLFVLYFGYLRAASRHGMEPNEGRTPNELRGPMARALPGAPVELLTERFNAACYGHVPSSSEDVRSLRNGLREFDAGAARDVPGG